MKTSEGALSGATWRTCAHQAGLHQHHGGQQRHAQADGGRRGARGRARAGQVGEPDAQRGRATPVRSPPAHGRRRRDRAATAARRRLTATPATITTAGHPRRRGRDRQRHQPDRGQERRPPVSRPEGPASRPSVAAEQGRGRGGPRRAPAGSSENRAAVRSGRRSSAARQQGRPDRRRTAPARRRRALHRLSPEPAGRRRRPPAPARSPARPARRAGPGRCRAPAPSVGAQRLQHRDARLAPRLQIAGRRRSIRPGPPPAAR